MTDRKQMENDRHNTHGKGKVMHMTHTWKVTNMINMWQKKDIPHMTNDWHEQHGKCRRIKHGKC